MSSIIETEQQVIGRIKKVAGVFLKVTLTTFSDYKQRHINVSAASVSFYAIFAVFPMLAFMAYLVSQVTGGTDSSATAPLVIKLVREFVPGMEGWIEKGLFNIVRGNSVTNWVNGLLLGWASFGLFVAVEAVFEHLPRHEHHQAKSHTERFFLALGTFAIFTALILTVINVELTASIRSMPVWVRRLPEVLKSIVVMGSKSGVITGVASVLLIGILYRILTPFKIRLHRSFAGSALFTALLFGSTTIFGIYLQRSQATMQSTYGAFSTLIVLMLWIHFIVNCAIYCGLFSYHLELRARGERHGDRMSSHSGHSRRHAA